MAVPVKVIGTPEVSIGSVAEVRLSYLRPTARGRYETTLDVNDTGSVVNLIGLRKLEGRPDVFIYRISIVLYNIAAGNGTPLEIWKVGSVGGGSLSSPTFVTKKDSRYPNSTLEIRTVAPTSATLSGNPWLVMGTSSTGASALTGTRDMWTALDFYDMMRLTGGEGLIFRTAGATDIDTIYNVTIGWEEANLP